MAELIDAIGTDDILHDQLNFDATEKCEEEECDGYHYCEERCCTWEGECANDAWDRIAGITD